MVSPVKPDWSTLLEEPMSASAGYWCPAQPRASPTGAKSQPQIFNLALGFTDINNLDPAATRGAVCLVLNWTVTTAGERHASRQCGGDDGHRSPRGRNSR